MNENKRTKPPAVMIAATGSGRGKTTVVCAILAALKRRGANVRSFKCGPDYIDPMFHRAVLDVPSKNLDLFFTDEARTRELFALENNAEVAVVEGVMGLYDGLSLTSDRASSYRLARALDLPVVLVVDARGMGRSLLAEIRGFLAQDEESRVVGVILNRVSQGVYKTIAPTIENELKIETFGYFPQNDELALESRYLGLKLAHEVDALREKTALAARVAEETLELDRLVELANRFAQRSKKQEFAHDPEPSVPPTPKVRIAVAQDEAFCFYYEDNLRLLQESGAALVPFSPLRDRALPKDVGGLLLGGGYPELYARELTENASLRADVKRAFDAGIPALAECGGFMWLCERIVDQEGGIFEMVGATPGECRYTGGLVRFGYATFREKTPRFLPPCSEIRGHEFHYFDGDDVGEDCVATKPSGKSWDCAHVSEDRWLGFAHLYYPSNPEFPKRFVDRCAQWKGR